MEETKVRSVWSIFRRFTSFFRRRQLSEHEDEKKTKETPLIVENTVMISHKQALPSRGLASTDELVKSAVSDTAVMKPQAKSEHHVICNDHCVGRPRRSLEGFSALRSMLQLIPKQSDTTKKARISERPSEHVPKHLLPLLNISPNDGQIVFEDEIWGIPLAKRNFSNIDTSTTIGVPPIGEPRVVGFLKYEEVDEDLEALKRWFYRFRYC